MILQNDPDFREEVVQNITDLQFEYPLIEEDDLEYVHKYENDIKEFLEDPQEVIFRGRLMGLPGLVSRKTTTVHSIKDQEKSVSYSFIRTGRSYTHYLDTKGEKKEYCRKEINRITFCCIDSEIYIEAGWGYDEVGSAWIAEENLIDILRNFGYEISKRQ